MMEAVEILRRKGHEISDEEALAVYIGILLHDIGHGPFSHALEHSIAKEIHHESISLLFMEELNKQFDGKLDLAIKIFKGEYERQFLHQLISSQLDMDRLDYLRRDSFYTGVTEGRINAERLLTMLNVQDDQLVVDAKGIYSVEKFIIARRLMYWQVYLHKTVLSAEFLLMMILKRAREIYSKGVTIHGSSSLRAFLSQDVNMTEFKSDPQWLYRFSRLDDYDLLSAVKEWCHHDDEMLSELSHRLIDRRLLAIEVFNEPISKDYHEEIRERTRKQFGFSNGEEDYLVFVDSIDNHAYDPRKDKISLLYKDGTTREVAEAADQLNIQALSHTVTRHFICYPKEVRRS